jgi:large subunit ribosomal protein L4
MATLDVVSPQGSAAGTVEAPDALFAMEPNAAVMHQVVTAQLAARRAGTQSTKTRAEVAGGGAKPWRQKGTGRSRQGSIRSPQWAGGGVALGPKPRSHRQRTPKKMIRRALASALSDRAADGRVRVLESWGIDTPSTRSARQVIEALGLEGRVLAVISRSDQAVAKSLRNLPQVHAVATDELNAYDVLVSDWLVFTKDSLP